MGGGEAVITDISFQRVSQDIKVARGDHYSDIVRASLFPSSQASAFPASPSSPPSSPLPLSSSLVGIARPRCDRERKKERERGREGKEVSLSEFLVRSSVTLSQIHFAVGEFPLVHVPWKSGRGLDFNRANFLPLLHGSFSPSPLPSSFHRFNRRLRDPPSFENGRGEKNLLMDRSLIRTREEILFLLPYRGNCAVRFARR